MLQLHDLVLAAFFGVFILFQLCRCMNIKRVFTYLSNVLDISKKKSASNSNPPRFVAHLNKYSEKIHSWYEQASTGETSDHDDQDNSENGSSSDDENENIIEYNNSSHKKTQRKKDKIQVRSIEVQTIVQNLPPPVVNFQNSSWREDQRRTGTNSNNNDDRKPFSSGRFAIRIIQQEQLQMLLKEARYFSVRDMRAPLIIVVECNSTNISGFLLNLKTRVCKFYVYEIRRLPWKLETPLRDWDNDTTEFKMKNIIFALLLWEQEILMMKKFNLYVNCWAVNHQDCKFGVFATDFLEHFGFCENIVRVNSNSLVSRNHNTDLFAKLIQPARELMTWNMSRFNMYLKKAYGIMQFEGSHSFLDDYKQRSKDDGYFARTHRYDSFLNKVNKNAEKWATKGCNKCDFKFSRNLELKSELFSKSISDADPGLLPYLSY